MGRLGKVIRGLLALLLTVAVWQAVAEPQSAGRAFNHMTTGFALSGGHAAAACETCHNGGVFKGTPRNCDGCHATGKRIVATPKSNNHIFTDAPCESCHFNTASWLGARFNHGTAKTGQCTTCHNGRIAAGKPASHNASLYISNSCDKCHRSSAWIPASWNHTGVAGDCGSCHNAANRFHPLSAHLPDSTMSAMSMSCNACHKSYYSFSNSRYDHVGASECDTCHGNPALTRVSQKKDAIHNFTEAMGLNCQSCHKNFVAFTSATFNHAGAIVCENCHSGTYTANNRVLGKGATHFSTTLACASCHKSKTTWLGATFDHSTASTACETCHANAGMVGVKQKSSAIHNVALPGVNCQSCHKSYTSFVGGKYDHTSASACATCHSGSYTVNGQIRGKHAAHITTTAACDSCHKSKTTWLGASAHTGNEAGQCLNCHLSQRPSNHNTSAYLVSCDACHSTSNWNFNHAAQQGKHTCVSCHLSKGQKEHKSITVGSKYYNCDTCHTVNTWDR